MKDQFTEEGDHHHLVIGIDYGTTYSGVGFALSSSDDQINEVQVINKWPSHNHGSKQDKVPSQIAYNALNKATGLSQTAWGYQIEAHMARCAWMKLHLDGNVTPSKYDDPGLQKEIQEAVSSLPEGKTAQDVTSDYLKEFYAHTMAKLTEKFGRELMEMTKIKFWFTMPAIWSDVAQAKTRDAAITAKIGTRRGDEICMIKEPEAAALATLSRTVKGWDSRIEVGDVVLVVDCGGGTVDLTTYAVKEFYPKLILREACSGTGAKCGATYLDRNLRELMIKYFGDAFKSIKKEKIGIGSRFMEDFEYNKRRFGTEGVDLKPLSLFIRGARDSEHYQSKRGKVILNNSDMEKIFAPVISIILQLVEGQIHSAKSKKVNNLMLVGGFGDSPHLQNKLGDWCIRNSIELRAPGNNWNAVAKGAVLRGLGQASVATRLCRRHYGVKSAELYEEGKNRKDWKDPFTKQWYALGYMKWHINKDQEIREDTVNPLGFFTILPEGQHEFDTNLYYSELDDAPKRFNDPSVQKIGECIRVDLSSVDMSRFQVMKSRGARVIRLMYIIEVVLGQRMGTISFRVKIDNKVIGQADIVWDE